jgi:hypothetical protein
MSVIAFCGFDFAVDATNNFGGAFQGSISAQSAWDVLNKPAWLFHNKGVATLNQTTAPPNTSASATGGLFFNRTTSGYAIGSGGGSSVLPVWTAGTTVTRATYATAQGAQFALVRSMLLPNPHTSADIYMTMDILCPSLGVASIASSFTPSASWGAIFKWGDVEIKAKSSTYISGAAGVAIHDLVFSVLNNGAEIATITVPNAQCGSTVSTNTWLFLSVHVKLDGSTGLIDASISGVAQSASYTGQNTVNTIALASATEIYFGPITLDDGTTAYQGFMDHVLFDDSAFPAGRPTVRLITPLADDSLTDAQAYGVGATTVVNALSTPYDTRQLRFTSAAGRAQVTLTTPATAGFLTDVLGFQIGLEFLANRNPRTARKVAAGVSLAGVDSEDAYMKAKVLPFSSLATSEGFAVGNSALAFIFEKPAGAGKYAASDMASMKMHLRSYP